MTPVELDPSALKSSVAFTGRLACMTRAEAFAIVRGRGGTPSQTVTKRTNLLIVGELGWPLLDDGRPSNKLSRANAYGVPVVSERRFLEWIGKAVPDSAGAFRHFGRVRRCKSPFHALRIRRRHHKKRTSPHRFGDGDT